MGPKTRDHILLIRFVSVVQYKTRTTVITKSKTGLEVSDGSPNQVYEKVLEGDSVPSARECVLCITLKDDDGAGISGRLPPASVLLDEGEYW
jgi:hypothetical protein